MPDVGWTEWAVPASGTLFFASSYNSIERRRWAVANVELTLILPSRKSFFSWKYPLLEDFLACHQKFHTTNELTGLPELYNYGCVCLIGISGPFPQEMVPFILMPVTEILGHFKSWWSLRCFFFFFSKDNWTFLGFPPPFLKTFCFFLREASSVLTEFT